jgi:hypothetical protein
MALSKSDSDFFGVPAGFSFDPFKEDRASAVFWIFFILFS